MQPTEAAAMTTTGMPLSMQVMRTPSAVSLVLPVGSSEPQIEPATSQKLIRTGAAVPGYARDVRIAVAGDGDVRRTDFEVSNAVGV